MADALLPIWGIILICSIVALLDWLARAQEAPAVQGSPRGVGPSGLLSDLLSDLRELYEDLLELGLVLGVRH